MVEGWKYYNHAAIPTTPPHIVPNLSPLEDGSIWDKGVCLVRWNSDWDCSHETEWWYCIKDTPFDIQSLKSKRRYEINKGNRNFSVKKIDPLEFKDDLYSVTLAAYSGWPEKYRPKVSKEVFFKQIEGWSSADVFAGFDVGNGHMEGYAQLMDYGSYVEFSVLRTVPDAEKKAVNAAMVSAILEFYRDRFTGEFYISDGSRAIRHETEFQNYLEKYFCFRKAYCRLNIRYRVDFGILVQLLYPFREMITSDSGLGCKISGILKMEKIRRSFRKGKIKQLCADDSAK